jgi:flagellar hook-basal body complex protein FliE
VNLGAIAAPASSLEMAPLPAPQAIGPAAQPAGAFESLLSSLTQLNGDLNAGEQGLRNLAVGNIDNLHQSMMNMERVRLSLQLLLQVRSRALDAYQELMRMQV